MITLLILENYNRFFLNNIKKIVYSPKMKLQLILGSNGSGKSSLLKELNPLPINKNDFNENGYKEIHIEHNNNKFIIKSTLTKNSFLVNDKELNPGGTKKVQLTLIKEYFKLTPRYNNVVLGTEKLTTMSPNDRKTYLREMSTVDYSYSIYLYNTLKQHLRDAVGFLKVISTELNNDVSILVPDGEVNELKKDINKIKHTIESLITRYRQTEDKVKYSKDFTLLSRVNTFIKDNINSLDIVELRNTVLKNETLLKTINTEMDTLNEEIDKLDNYTKITKDTDIIKDNLSELESYFEKLSMYDHLTSLDKMLAYKHNESFQYSLRSIATIITELSYFDDSIFSTQEHILTKQERDIAFNKVNLSKNKIVSYEKELEILKNNKVDDNKITCKKCGDVSYFGYEPDREKELLVLLEEANTRYKILNKSYLDINEVIRKQEAKIQLLSDLKNKYSDNGILSLWNELITNYAKDKEIPLKSITGITASILSVVNNNINDILNSFSDYHIKMKEFNDLSYKLKVDNELLVIYKQKHKDDTDKLVTRLEYLTSMKKEVMLEIQTTNSTIQKVIEFTNIKEVLINNVNLYSKNTKNNVIRNKNKIIKDTIDELKNLLLILEDRYNNSEKIKNRIINNKKLTEQYEKERDALILAVRALSPTEGLIAKSINSFINVFLNEMNTIINSVWSYDITLLPCQVNDSNDLDYQFMVEVDNKQRIADVRDLSSSMKDIVDLSFKIVFMKYMHLTHMPLILDEFGITMDDKHRFSVYHVIENVLSNNFSQIYFTANFKSIYGRFVDSEIVILDDKNLEIENLTFNTNIEITN